MPVRKRLTPPLPPKPNMNTFTTNPTIDNKKVRVAGPFTVESLSPHRVLGVDENDELIDSAQGNRLSNTVKARVLSR